MKNPRQKPFQERNLARGMCRFHSTRPATRGTLCEACATYQRGYQARRRAAAGARRLKSREAWAQVDWTQKFEAIAEQMGVVLSAVSYQYTRYLARGGAYVQSGLGRPRRVLATRSEQEGEA